MPSEGEEHKRIKEIVSKALTENLGNGLKEYPDCGNIADSCVITSDGIKIFVEVVWTSTKNNFNRDLNILHRSDADVKILIVNPKFLEKPLIVREFVKTQMSEIRKGSVVCDMIDGSRILNDPDFVNSEFLTIVRKQLEARKGRSNERIKPKEKLKHSKRILLTRSDYQGLDCWSHDTLMKNLLISKRSEQLEIKCLMQHFETGYNAELWKPLMEYEKILKKYGYLKIATLGRSFDATNEKKPTLEEEQRAENLRKQFLKVLDEAILVFKMAYL